jgi:hypothetical protein
MFLVQSLALSHASTIENHTSLLNSLISSTAEGNTLKPGLNNIYLHDKINLNTGLKRGVTIDFEGANIYLENDNAGFIIGQTHSGLKNATIHTTNNYSGTATKVIHYPVIVSGPKTLQNINYLGGLGKGVAIEFSASQSKEFISFVNILNITIKRFEYGIKMVADSLVGGAFINGNNFSNIIFLGQTNHGIYLDANNNESNEVSGNNFSNIQIQYSNETINHLFVGDQSSYNSFTNFMTWDGAGSNKLLIDVRGQNNTLIGTAPTSGNTAQYSNTTNRLMHTDSGSQTNIIQIGERIIENSRYKHKTLIFNDTSLPILDVRDGDVLIDKNTTFKSRLTNIKQGQDGQTIKIIFSGNTLLSNGWGGEGQFKLANSSSYIPLVGDVKSFTFFDGIWYEE